MATVAELAEVRFARGGISVLRDISGAFAAGTITVVSGANGVGKTTLLGILAGVVTADAGIVRLPTSRSFLPELFRPPPMMSPASYLTWVAAARGVPRRGRSEAVHGVAESLGLILESGRTRMREYSRGNLQKIGLAQALTTNPSLVVLDEPLSGLDDSSRQAALDAIAGAARAGSAVVMSHHGSRIESPSVERLTLKDGVLAPTRDAPPVVFRLRHTTPGLTPPLPPDAGGDWSSSRAEGGAFLVSYGDVVLSSWLEQLDSLGWAVEMVRDHGGRA